MLRPSGKSFPPSPIVMKTCRHFASAFVLTAAFALRSGAAVESAPRAESIFDHPDKFTDVRDFNTPTDRGRDAILGQIRDYMVRQSKYYVPEGCKLTVTFTDIHL